MTEACHRRSLPRLMLASFSACARSDLAAAGLALAAAVGAAWWTGERGYLVLAGFAALIGGVIVVTHAAIAATRGVSMHAEHTDEGNAR